MRPRGGSKQLTHWLLRFAELQKFIDDHGRFPDRHVPAFEGESSLAWWLKDQRRKMRHGETQSRKRGTLNDKQIAMLLRAGVSPVGQ